MDLNSIVFPQSVPRDQLPRSKEISFCIPHQIGWESQNGPPRVLLRIARMGSRVISKSPIMGHDMPVMRGSPFEDLYILLVFPSSHPLFPEFNSIPFIPQTPKQTSNH